MKTKQLRTQLPMFYRQTVTTIFVMMFMVIFVGHDTLSAAPAKGLKVKAHMKDGSILGGDLRNIDGKKLVLYDHHTQKILEASMDQVNNLKISKKRNVIKGLFTGTLMGVLTSVISTEDNTLPEYNALHYIFFVPSGFAVGAVSEIFHPRPKNYHINTMTEAEIENLLTVLKNANWNSITGKDWYKDGILGRLRFSWRPFFHHGLSLKFNTHLSLANGALPNEQVTADGSLSEFSNTNETHVRGRIRMEYALKDWLSIGGEYFSLGQTDLYGDGGIQITQGDQHYVYHNYGYGSYNAKVYLMSASFGLPNAKGQLRGLRLETGVGLASTQLQFNENSPFWHQKTYNKVNPAFQIGMSMELFPEASFTTGIYATYLYAPSSFPGFQASGNGPFFNTVQTPGQTSVPAFGRDIEYDFHKSNFNANGFSLGFLLRFR